VTERIDELLGAIDGVDPALIAALDEDDQRDAFARAVSVDDPNRERALAILAASDPGPAGFLASAVGQVIADLASSSSVMTTALSLAGAAESDTIVSLVAATAANTQDPLIGLAAWRTLQQIAGIEHFEELQAIAPQPGDVVGDQAAFALSVIAYRGGQSGFELHVPNDLEFLAVGSDEDSLLSISQSPVDDADFERVQRLAAGELYLLSPTPSATTALDCDINHMLLCMNPDEQDSAPGGLLQTPALAGIVVLLDSLGLDYSVRYLVLTWPDDEGGFHVALHQPDGAQAYYGHAKSEEMTDSEAPVSVFFALDRPGIARVAATFVIGSTGVTMGGDQLVSAEISGDRLVPEAD
jgi:hypothetical protein